MTGNGSRSDRVLACNQGDTSSSLGSIYRRLLYRNSWSKSFTYNIIFQHVDVLDHTIPYYAILYYAVLHDTIPFDAVLSYHTML